MSWRRYAKYLHGEAAFQVLRYQPDSRGASYGGTWVPDGREFVGGYRKLNPTERYAMGLQSTLFAYRIFADPPLGDLEKLKVKSSATGELNVRSSLDEKSKGISLIVGDRTA